MTTLSATYSAGVAGTAPPRVLLQVAAAPSLTSAYAQNTAASVDSWAAGTNGSLAFNVAPNAGLKATNSATTGSTFVTFSRTVTGLTAGTTYVWTVPIVKATTEAPFCTIVVTGKAGATSFWAPATRAVVTYTFTATATSHVLELRVRTGKATAGGTVAPVAVTVDTMTVRATGTWQGTTIRRTDANGTSVIVRENDGGQDTAGTTGSATMTVTDYEAALTGTVSYTVTDGNGGTANASVGAPTTPGAWMTLPATAIPGGGSPTAPTHVPIDAVIGYTENAPSNGSVHVIIGRADPIVNPGPLALRQGRMTCYCADYATARALRVMLAGGQVAMLRQPALPGMDLYLYPRNVTIESPQATDPRRWEVSLDYQEVAAP